MSMIDVKTALNDNIGVDLIAINQYFFHARVLKHWGYEKLGSLIYKRSIEVSEQALESVEPGITKHIEEQVIKS